VPTLVVLSGVRVLMFAADHTPPHFHAQFAEHVVLIRISDLAVIRGSLPRAKLDLVLDWAHANKGLLVHTWHRLNGETA